ncbi:MAG TPA: recombinase family protein [Ktedonobacteraceae bacterium]
MTDVVDIYRHTAANDEERPSLSQMRQRIRDGEIQGVVVATIDRLSRDQAHLIILMEETAQHNVQLHGVSKELDETSL